MSLQQKVRYFQYMRPRYSNPSLSSSNVGASLGMSYFPTPAQVQKHKPVMKISNTSDIIEPKITIIPQVKVPQSPQTQNKNHRRSKSNLSNYGTNSLGNLPKVFNERDIYEKQEKKYNIITIMPKQYNETIKKYPKYRLQNMDQNYYKKLELQQQYKHYKGGNQMTVSNPEAGVKEALIGKNQDRNMGSNYKNVSGDAGYNT